MPTYEYACPVCGIIEVFQSMSEKALTRCPTCKKRKVTRMVSGGAALIFKGSGFWETDYNRSDDYKKKSKAEAPEPQAKTQSEAKPATTTTPASGTPSTTATPAPVTPTPPAPKSTPPEKRA